MPADDASASDSSDDEFVVPDAPTFRRGEAQGAASSDEESDTETPQRTSLAALDEGEAGDLATDAGDLAAYGRGKRRAGPAASPAKPAAAPERSSEADAIWEVMKASAPPEKLPIEPEQKVRVTRTYRFAGEDVHEEVELPADHPAAQQSSRDRTPVPPPDKGPVPKRPLARKRKAGLATLAAAAKAKPPKLNTVEKSKMDWEAYKAQGGLSTIEVEEMEAQTRGGSRGRGMEGYLDRSDFLKRVHARQEEQMSDKK